MNREKAKLQEEKTKLEEKKNEAADTFGVREVKLLRQEVDLDKITARNYDLRTNSSC